jgi:hypothetical protein
MHVGGIDAAVIISPSRATVALVTWFTASWRLWDGAGSRGRALGWEPADLGLSPVLKLTSYVTLAS